MQLVIDGKSAGALMARVNWPPFFPFVRRIHFLIKYALMLEGRVFEGRVLDKSDVNDMAQVTETIVHDAYPVTCGSAHFRQNRRKMYLGIGELVRNTV